MMISFYLVNCRLFDTNLFWTISIYTFDLQNGYFIIIEFVGPAFICNEFLRDKNILADSVLFGYLIKLLMRWIIDLKYINSLELEFHAWPYQGSVCFVTIKSIFTTKAYKYFNIHQ